MEEDVKNNGFACQRYCNVNYRRYNNHQLKNNTSPKNIQNVHIMFTTGSVSGHYEQCVAIYQF